MAAFKVVPSGIIYGRMGRTMRNYGLRIIARPENKHSLLRRGRKSLPGSSDHGWWACRSSWRSLSWMPKNHPRVRLWNQRHDYWRACPLSHTVDDFMTFIKQGRHSETQTGCEPKQARAHPNPGPYRYILHACKIKLPEHVVAKMVYGTDVADDV